jgi:hypothetical protein
VIPSGIIIAGPSSVRVLCAAGTRVTPTTAISFPEVSRIGEKLDPYPALETAQILGELIDAVQTDRYWLAIERIYITGMVRVFEALFCVCAIFYDLRIL